MIIRNVELENVCGPTSKLPVNTLPELAFAGRSNVGKSSLINALTGRKAIARTSSKPGKTQTINFYRVVAAEKAATDDIDFYLVDLPGYGYAKRSKEQVAQWGPMIENYLRRSHALHGFFLLIDVRLPAQESDLQMLEFARHLEERCVIIATKADKLKKNELAKQTSLLKKEFALREDERFIPFSAVNKTGLFELQDVMLEMIQA